MSPVPTGNKATPIQADRLIRELYRAHGKTLLAYLTRILSDRQLAEDVLQETMLRAWLHFDELAPDRGSIPNWLARVGRNIAFDKLRARKSRPVEVAENLAWSGFLADPSAPVDSVVDSVLLSQALSKISPKHRDALCQVYLHGLRRLRDQLSDESIGRAPAA
jgi:RNA polymerase sigma-70 factor (ECF subfamily)